MARTDRNAERAAAEALSGALGGFPLAHEQAAAYCERLEISLADYLSPLGCSIPNAMRRPNITVG